MEREGEFRLVLPGSKEHVRGGEEGFAGTWEILSSPRTLSAALGGRVQQTPRPCDGASEIAREQSNRRNRGTAKRSKTKRGGMDDRKS